MVPHTYHNGCKYMVLKQQKGAEEKKQQFFTLIPIFLVFISLPLYWVLAPTCGQSNRTLKGQWWYPPWNHACTVFYTFGIHNGCPILIHWFGQAVMAKGLRQRCFGTGCVKKYSKDILEFDPDWCDAHIHPHVKNRHIDAIWCYLSREGYHVLFPVSGRDPPGKGQTLASSAYNYDHYDESWPQGCAGMSGTLGAKGKGIRRFQPAFEKMCLWFCLFEVATA